MFITVLRNTNYTCESDDTVLSENVDKLYNELQVLKHEYRTYVRYCNVLELFHDNELDEHTQRECEHKELSVLMKRDVNSTLNIVELSTSFDASTMFHVDGRNINLNTKAFASMLSHAIAKHKVATLVIPYTSNIMNESFYILFGVELVANKDSNDNMFAKYIDFLFAMYEQALYVMNLVINIGINVNLKTIITTCDDNEHGSILAYKNLAKKIYTVYSESNDKK